MQIPKINKKKRNQSDLLHCPTELWYEKPMENGGWSTKDANEKGSKYPKHRARTMRECYVNAKEKDLHQERLRIWERDRFSNHLNS